MPVVGLQVEPAQEELLRLRIMASRMSGDRVTEDEAVQRLLRLTEQLGCYLEPESMELLAAV